MPKVRATMASSKQPYTEICSEVIGRSVGSVDDAVADLHNALHTEHTHPGAWAAVSQAARELADRAEQLADRAHGRDR